MVHLVVFLKEDLGFSVTGATVIVSIMTAVTMVGQPELSDRLDEPGLRQLKQRIALRCELSPLDLNETAAYVAARVRVAGGRPDVLFTRDAILTIFEREATLRSQLPELESAMYGVDSGPSISQATRNVMDELT